MRGLIIIALFLGATYAFGQNSGSIGVPGDYPEGGTDDQIISISNDTLFLEDGGFVVLPDGGVSDNWFSADLTQTANRTHDGGGNNFTWAGTSQLDIDVNILQITADPGDIGIEATDGNITFTSGNTTNFLADGSITFSSGNNSYWFLSPPATDNTEDVLLAFDGSGKLELRDVSSLPSDGLGSSPTSGAILFGQGTTTTGIDATNFFWDDANNRLGIGTATPVRQLDLVTSDIIMAKFSGSGAQARFTIDHASGTNTGFQLATGGVGRYSIASFQGGSGNLEFTIYNEITGGFPIAIDGSTDNVGLGTYTPNASAKLEIAGTTGAVLLPRLTTTQRDALTPAAGMIIYNTTTGTFQGYTTTWTNL